ncbi:MAG: hypothetical protein RSB70_02145 [Clostridium sp.]
MIQKYFDSLRNISLKELNENIIYKGIIIIAIFLQAIIGVILLNFYKVSILEILKYTYFVIVFVILQGAFSCRVINYNCGKLEKFIASYALGMGVCIVEYYIFKRFFFKDIMFFMGNLIAVIEVYLRVLNGLKYREFSKDAIENSHISKGNLGIILLCTSFILMNLWGASMTSPLPDLVGRVTYDNAVLDVISKAQSYERAIPAMSAQVSNVELNVQSFKPLYMASISSMTGISTVKVGFYLVNISNIFFMILSLYLMLKKFFNSRKYAAIGSLSIFLANGIYGVISNEGSLRFKTIFKDLMFSSNGTEITLIYLFLIIYYMVKILEENTTEENGIEENGIEVRVKIIIICLFIALIANNIYLAIIVLLSVIALPKRLIKSNYLKKDIKNLQGIIIFMIIIGLFFIFTDESISLSMKLMSKSNQWLGMELFLDAKNKISPIGFGIIGKMLSFIIDIIYAIVRYILFIPPISLIYIYIIKRKYKTISEQAISKIYIYILSVILVIASYVIGFKELDEKYLLSITLIFIIIVFIESLSEGLYNTSTVKKYIFISLMIIPLTTTILGVFNGINLGLAQFSRVMGRDKQEAELSYDSITKGEYHALQWINLNSTKDDVIATDMHYTDDSNSDKVADHKYYSVFSERQMYLEGYKESISNNNYVKSVLEHKSINERIYINDSTVLPELIAANIRFIMVSPQRNPNLLIDWDRVEKVFENNEALIYEIK